MICPQCQTQLKEDQSICPQCGLKVTDMSDVKQEVEDNVAIDNQSPVDTIAEEIEKDPLIIEPALNNEEQPTILDTSYSPTAEKENDVKIYATSFFNYIKRGLQAPFASTISVTEKEFPFAVGLFILTILIIPCTLYLFMSQLLHTAAFHLGIFNSLLPFWKTVITLSFAILLTQTALILLFISIVKLQRSNTTVKLLFIRYMHIGMLSIIGYIVAFFLAFLNSPLAIFLTLGCLGLHLALVSLLFFIERRENSTLIDPVYNVILFLLGSYFITYILFSTMNY